MEKNASQKAFTAPINEAFARMLDKYGANWGLALQTMAGRMAFWEMKENDAPRDASDLFKFAQKYALRWGKFEALFLSPQGDTIERLSFSVTPTFGQYAEKAAPYVVIGAAALAATKIAKVW